MSALQEDIVKLIRASSNQIVLTQMLFYNRQKKLCLRRQSHQARISFIELCYLLQMFSKPFVSNTFNPRLPKGPKGNRTIADLTLPISQIVCLVNHKLQNLSSVTFQQYKCGGLSQDKINESEGIC